MTKNDLHSKPFDEATLTKLDIFQQYAAAWIPTFVMQAAPRLYIFDFFAGSGADSQGIPGSPIRLLTELNKYFQHIIAKNVRVYLHFNDISQKKIILLEKTCETFFAEHPDLRKAITIEYSHQDFEKSFNDNYTLISKYPSLVFIDQSGVKFIEKKYLLELEKTNQTDFLYFISSSYFWRFGETEEFKKHLPIDINILRDNPYRFIHRTLLAKLKSFLPIDSKLKLYPFSLKKGSNIYGIVFGAKHLRAVEKFLSIGWKINGINGDANFDIDQDQSKRQIDAFDDHNKTKLELFQELLEKSIMNGFLTTNTDIYKFSLALGHPPKHASEYLRQLKREGKVSFEGSSPKVTFEALKDKNIVEVEYID